MSFDLYNHPQESERLEIIVTITMLDISTPDENTNAGNEH